MWICNLSDRSTQDVVTPNKFLGKSMYDLQLALTG